ncbi:MAG: GAF domain-containing protein [Gaiellaceae bacterium]
MPNESVERAAAALGRETTIRGLLHTACQELVNTLGASACAISRVVGDLLVGLAEFSRDDRRLALEHEYLISDFPLTQEVIVRGQARAVSLLETAPEPNEAALLEKLGYSSLLMVCLPAGGECWGLVEVYADATHFDERQTAAAEEIADVAGRQLERLERID